MVLSLGVALNLLLFGNITFAVDIQSALFRDDIEAEMSPVCDDSFERFVFG